MCLTERSGAHNVRLCVETWFFAVFFFLSRGGNLSAAAAAAAAGDCLVVWICVVIGAVVWPQVWMWECVSVEEIQSWLSC